MRLNPLPTELTTAATDAALALLCLGVAASIWRCRRHDPWKTGLWLWLLSLLALASALGAVAHGVDLSDGARAVLWHPLYLCLGLTVALFVVGAILDWRGHGLARLALPWALLCALAFSLVTPLLGGSFLLFIGYEAIAMSGALLIYLTIFWRGQRPGSGLIAVAILLSMLAAAVQASDLTATILVPLDHNGLFHLLQMAAIIVLGIGLRAGLQTGHG
ncbi:MAG TPA: hypothetical protein DDY20_03945 [Desulfobulbaceae bacterium]|nr:hypothetical protein [Desulfobulbaceae bacterium]